MGEDLRYLRLGKAIIERPVEVGCQLTELAGRN
jgi:hypothetical protein